MFHASSVVTPWLLVGIPSRNKSVYVCICNTEWQCTMAGSPLLSGVGHTLDIQRPFFVSLYVQPHVSLPSILTLCDVRTYLVRMSFVDSCTGFSRCRGCSHDVFVCVFVLRSSSWKRQSVMNVLLMYWALLSQPVL